MKAPCKDCPDREVGCHGKCDKYAQFKEERNKEIETIISKSKVFYTLINMTERILKLYD